MLKPVSHLSKPFATLLERMFRVDELNRLYLDARQKGDESSLPELLIRQLEATYEVSDADCARIPVAGPAVVVANHPFGLIEANVLAALLPRIRPDMKILANHLLSTFPELWPYALWVDPFGGGSAVRTNVRGLREAIEWLRSGHLLAVFPAGEVAHIDWRRRAITDPPWNPNVARLIQLSRAAAVPVYFDGVNSALFHFLGAIHPRLRTALLPHEFLNKQRRRIEVRIGRPIAFDRLSHLGSDKDVTTYLRSRTYLLSHRKPVRMPVSCGRTPGGGVESWRLEHDVARLSGGRLLAESGSLRAYLASAAEIPNVLREIGRLREVTFRAAGEGTGNTVDLDEFDAHYMHLFLWDTQSSQVVGAYRLGFSDRIPQVGLYTSTLFRYGEEFLDRIGPAIELGRSFVRPERQKGFHPLMLLWKGVGAVVASNPRYRTLFGAVSISNEYRPASRQLMVNVLSRLSRPEHLAMLVKARSPFRRTPLAGCEAESVVWDLDELSALVADIEDDQKGVPVLIRQYLKLGGQFVAFNVDAKFANALDGLIVVDLRRTQPKLLERYMGKAGANAFAARWAA